MEDDYIIKSEIDGVVYRINKEAGEVINTQEPVVIIGTEEFIIELSIDELDIDCWLEYHRYSSDSLGVRACLV